MDFKNKLGTVDAHKLNLNFKSDNTDSHNIILNFEHMADGSTNLNFGDDVTAAIDTALDTGFLFEVTAVYADSGENTAVIDTVLYTEFSFEVVAVFKDNIDVIGQIDTVLDTSFSFEVEAVFRENLCTIDTVLDTGFSFEVKALFDINHLVGVSYGFDMRYQKAIAALSTTEIPWAKPILRVSNEALFYDQGLVVSNQVNIQHEQAGSLTRAIRSFHEQATGLSSDAYVIWEEGNKRFIHQHYLHEETIKLRHNRETVWQEMIRRRKTFTYSHEVAQVFEYRFSFEWDKSLEIVTRSDLPWDKAKAIHYRKHLVQHWPKPELPKYEGSTDLNFICLCHDVDSHNVVLNFGADDCIPALPKRNWWYIVNTLTAERLDTGEKIKVIDGSYSTSQSQWCWTYSITVAHTEKDKLQPIDGHPVILKVMINGFEHHILLEDPEETRRFASVLYTYPGRSITALNSDKYAASRSFIQDNERTSVQLVQAELDRANGGTTLDWKLIDELGWIVPVESLSYAELAPIDAIKQVVDAAGGFIYSQKAGNTLTILPRYQKGYWDTMTVDDYDILLSESLVMQQNIKQNDEYIADFNAITVVNSRSGESLKVQQRGTSGDVPLESVTGPLFNLVSGASYGKAELIKANIQELHTFADIPVSQEIGEMLPGKTIAFNGQWWGVIDGVSGSFSHEKVNETITVERISRE
ncbi:hypothetical protein [Acinetobacter variabilis]|uniref:Uncharacterized protein n=1 Tax=Acinetobacter variabilis TaxID=70346 RepID=N9MGC1_9GAMM|nr:hypothetical protein [Acinetobacter variabilis]ENX07619.1 hypothetical protein F897_02655 [Acinetobacter variabilis]UBI31579.1 hypothetical protein LA331_05335 [Acinetobacter variabilis]